MIAVRGARAAVFKLARVGERNEDEKRRCAVLDIPTEGGEGEKIN